jgi:hypothetical protein
MATAGNRTHPLRERRAPTADGLTVDAIFDGSDRRRIVYWSYSHPDLPRPVGAVSRRPEGFRALGYPLDGSSPSPTRNQPLGTHPSKRQAEAAVARWARGTGSNHPREEAR